MTWIDDDFEELKRQQEAASQLAAREAEISVHAEQVFNDLWTELVDRIAEAKQKRVTDSSLIVNGTPYSRKIIVGRLNAPPVHHGLSLSANKQSIVFTRPQGNIVLPFEVGDDGVIRIRHDGEPKLVGDVAKSLLRPILFPTLFMGQ